MSRKVARRDRSTERLVIIPSFEEPLLLLLEEMLGRYSDSQLLEAVAIVGYFNYINTIVNCMGSGK
jgi:hypothetical protein